MKPEQQETEPLRREVTKLLSATFDYVERWYNPQRLHSTLGYLSPIAFEEREALA